MQVVSIVVDMTKQNSIFEYKLSAYTSYSKVEPRHRNLDHCGEGEGPQLSTIGCARDSNCLGQAGKGDSTPLHGGRKHSSRHTRYRLDSGCHCRLYLKHNDGQFHAL